MGAVNNNEGGGTKYLYYNLKTKSAKFEQYVKDGANKLYDSMNNILLEKVGRRKKQIDNGPVFWEYCLLFTDMDNPEEKIIITVPNFGEILLRVFGPMFSLESICSLDLSPYIKNGHFKFAIRKHGEKPTVQYPYTFDNDLKWFIGVPKTVWTKKEKDGIVTNESDDTELKEFIVKELKEWCQKVLGTPFYQAEIGQRIFDDNVPASNTSAQPGKIDLKGFIDNVLGYYKTIDELSLNWATVMKRANEKVLLNVDETDVDYFFHQMEIAVKAKYLIIHEVVCDKDSCRIEVVEDSFHDDLPF